VRALLTGDCGFIGGHIGPALDDAGYAVTPADLADGFDVRHDLGDLVQRPGWYDVVVHCAAVVGGRRVMDWTPLKHAANLAIDAALFGWAERVKPGRVIYFSSSCAYPAALGEPSKPPAAVTGYEFAAEGVVVDDALRGRLRESGRHSPATWCADPRRPGHGTGCRCAAWLVLDDKSSFCPVREDDIDLHNPRWPDQLYGWTKLTGELLAGAARGAGVPVSVVRPFSVYGPGVREGFAVHGFAEQVCRQADPVVVWGDENQVRDYIHVSDVTRAVLAMIRDGIDGPANLGTGRATSLHDLAVMMAKTAGYEASVKVDAAMPAGVPFLVADNGLLREFCEPQVALEDGLAELLAS
jgi:nucleoside-diphosphate-sugar epimerase